MDRFHVRTFFTDSRRAPRAKRRPARAVGRDPRAPASQAPPSRTPTSALTGRRSWCDVNQSSAN